MLKTDNQFGADFMQLKAANHGDRLKHAVLLEVLGRAAKLWPSVTCAETHGGQAVYDASDQIGDGRHILGLQKLVDKFDFFEPGDEVPGGAYFKQLKFWWTRSGHRQEYPGSLALAHGILSGSSVPFTIRATEIDHGAAQRARDVFEGDDRVVIRCDSFHHHVGWLMDAPSVVLLVDAFEVMATPIADVYEMTQGSIDHGIISRILNKVLDHENAVACFWLSDHGPNIDVVMRTIDLVNRWGDDHWGPVETAYIRNAHTHSMLVAGDARIVGDLPLHRDWAKSWLGGTTF